MHPFDDGLRQLIEVGRKQGYLTFTQINDYLPDEAVNPEKLDTLLMQIEEMGLEVRDEHKVVAKAPSAPARPKRGKLAKPMADLIEMEGGRRIDDPVRLYLTQMGEIPLLTREQEIFLAKTIELTRKRFRQFLLESDFVAQQVIDVLGQVESGELPFDRTIKVSLTEGMEKDQILGRMPHN